MKQDNNNLLSQPPAPLYSALRHCGMTNGAGCGFPSPLAGEGARRAGEGYKKAFTLIELLVVVLIIGILAAVALPQYQKAVEKSRMTEGIMAAETIAKANDMYKMANGNYTRNINDLDIEFPGENYWYSGLAARNTKYFTLAASNASGDQLYKAVVQRHIEGTKYALLIMLNGSRYCQPYGQISAYERKLCEKWAVGQ